MGIAYKTHPANFEELCDSVRGQVERAQELGMLGETVPYSEAVELTSESVLGLLDRVRYLTDVVSHQALMFNQLNDILKWLFTFLGIPILDGQDTDTLDENE
jgi:Flp pilus assembly CpaE family ATPase